MDYIECTICKKVKPETMFYSDGIKNKKRRRRPECKKCYADRRKANELSKEDF